MNPFLLISFFNKNHTTNVTDPKIAAGSDVITEISTDSNLVCNYQEYAISNDLNLDFEFFTIDY